jgi:hypothetical protein
MSDTHPDQTHQLTVVAASIVVPVIVADASDQAVRRFLEFFAATIRK